MSTIDEILESGTYTDRRGREWILRDFGGGCEEWSYGIDYPFSPAVSHDEFYRRVIHRDVCEGLDLCHSHPVPHVLAGRARWGQFSVYGGFGSVRMLGSLPEAMDAARALAVAA